MARPLPTTKAQVSGHKFLRRRVEHGYLDEIADDLDDAIDRAVAAKNAKKAVSIGVVGNAADAQVAERAAHEAGDHARRQMIEAEDAGRVRFIEGLTGGRPQVVVRRLIDDLETPVSAFLKLGRDRPYACLLESVEGGAVKGRYSILTLDPDVVWRCRGEQAELARGAGVAAGVASVQGPADTAASQRTGHDHAGPHNGNDVVPGGDAT